jgi:hypothetical protein
MALLLAGLVWQAHAWTNTHSRIYTQLDLDVISQSIKAWSADSAATIPQTAVRQLDARVLYQLLSATNAGAYFLAHRQEWDRRQELTDPWGRPYHVQLTYPPDPSVSPSPTLLATVKIWSSGPNGRDESGAGDDILSQPIPIRLRR